MNVCTEVDSNAAEVGSHATEVGSNATEVGSNATEVGLNATEVRSNTMRWHAREVTVLERLHGRVTNQELFLSLLSTKCLRTEHRASATVDERRN